MSRILILNRRYCPGEAWTNRILAYAKGFAENGAEVVMYYIITDNNRTIPNFSIPNIKVVNLWESDGFIARKYKVISFLKNLLRFIREVKKDDNIFLYGGDEYQLRLGLRLKKKNAKIFCEITEHPHVFASSNFAIKKIDQKIKMMKQLDGIFVISNSLKKYFIKEGLSDERVHVINMFVDSNRFNELQKTTDEKYIAYCGAVSYDKDGVNILIQAFAKFYQLHKDYKLYIIGKSVEPSVILRLKELAQELGVEVVNRIVFTGAIPPNKMPQILYNASILALARPDNLQAQNGFPTKLGEYLATGNPVVITQVGEIPLFIKDMENGILSKPNPDSFSEKLSWVADNYEQAKLIGLRGKELSNTDFNYKSQSKKALVYMLK